jgi:UDP-glucose 4-epimerase
MRIAVTGGAGFIGAHVVDRLLDAGHDVLTLDLDVRRADPRADQRVVDVLDLAAVTDALAGCDAVFHIAGMSNVDVAYADPVRTVRLNVEGTGNVCEAARQVGVGRVLFASTVWVYGAVPETAPGTAGQGASTVSGEAAADVAAPLTEDATIGVDRAGHVYTSTKLAAELLLHSYHETYGLPFTILRYGIPYGPGMRDELVLARFVGRAMAGQPLTVAGDGRQFRRYVFVRDLADAHVRALGPAAENTTIALEGSERVSVLDMAEAVRGHFPGTTIEHVTARPGDYRGREISAQRAARLLDWRPTTSFQDGVSQYVAWYRANRSSAAPTIPPAPAAPPAAVVPPLAAPVGAAGGPSATSPRLGVPAASAE